MWETWVQSLGPEDPLEKEMATHSHILAWRIPWTEELGGLQSMGRKERTWLSDFTFFLPPNSHFMCSEYECSGPSGMVSQSHSLNFAEDWQSDKGKKTEKKGASEK